MGKRRILAVRRAREARDETFDLRQFHEDVILCAGGLDGLEGCLDMREAIREERSKREEEEEEEGENGKSRSNEGERAKGDKLMLIALAMVAVVFVRA